MQIRLTIYYGGKIEEYKHACYFRIMEIIKQLFVTGFVGNIICICVFWLMKFSFTNMQVNMVVHYGEKYACLYVIVMIE